MESSTHIFFGIGIASLATLDPALLDDRITVYLSCILASNAPDFDYVSKLKGKSEYYKNHRGFSHSLPMLPVWALLVTAGFMPFTTESEFLYHLFLWNCIAVIVHILTDLFNIHGTQAFRPFTKKWVSFDCVPLFDYFIMLIHVAGVLMIFAGHHPGKTFFILYFIIFGYILIRFIARSLIYQHLSTVFHQSVNIKIIPNMDLYSWQVIIERSSDYILGHYKWGKLEVDSALKKVLPPFHPWVDASRQDKDISNFIANTPYVYPKVINKSDFLEVRWIDLRFRKGKSFPFKGTWIYSHQKSSNRSYVGWFHHPIHFKRVKQKMVTELSK